MCVNKNKLQEAVEELRKLKTMRSDLDDMIKAQENIIIDYMKENELELERGDGWEVTYKTNSRSSLDSELLIPVLGSDLSEFKKTTFFKTLRVK